MINKQIFKPRTTAEDLTEKNNNFFSPQLAAAQLQR